MLLVTFLAQNLLTLSCRVKQAGRKSWGYPWPGRNRQFRLQFVSKWNQLPFQHSQHFCFSPLHLLCKVCSTAQWGGLYWWWEPGFLSQACPASHLHSLPVSEKNSDYFFQSMHRKSLVGDIWKWGHKDCYLQVWEHTTLSGSSMLLARLWTKVQDKQKPPSRASSHIK